MQLHEIITPQALPIAALAPPSGRVRLGILGCGYVTAMSHLPASRQVSNVEIVALVDARLDLAQQLAQQYGVSQATTDYRDLIGKVDAVIIALPHPLHAPVTLALLGHGVHVLVEKPMAMKRAECQQMIAAATAAQAKLAVGHMRRFYDSNQLVKRLIDTQFLGEVQRFEAEEAVIFERFKASPFTLLPPAGGVLFDTGTHVIDMLLWWLGDLTKLAYWDDAAGGVEANCRIEATTATGAEGVIEVSRTRRLGNSIRIFCEQGMLTVATLKPTEVWIESPLFSGPLDVGTRVVDEDKGALTPFFARQLTNFAAAILGDETLLVTGHEGMRNIAVIEQCKQVKQRLVPAAWRQLDQRLLAE